jgi:hypothetical protein
MTEADGATAGLWGRPLAGPTLRRSGWRRTGSNTWCELCWSGWCRKPDCTPLCNPMRRVAGLWGTPLAGPTLHRIEWRRTGSNTWCELCWSGWCRKRACNRWCKPRRARRREVSAALAPPRSAEARRRANKKTAGVAPFGVKTSRPLGARRNTRARPDSQLLAFNI